MTGPSRVNLQCGPNPVRAGAFRRVPEIQGLYPKSKPPLLGVVLIQAYGSVPSTGQRRPGLPRAGPAVLSARWGLASGFGTGPGVPPMLWPLTGGRRPPYLRCPGSHLRALGAAWRIGEVTRGHPRARTAHERLVPRAARCGSGRARAISAARLRTSPPLHLPSIDQVVYLGPYRKEN